MNWADAGKIIAPLAPAIGGILGSLIPIPGGGLVGTAVGTAIAKHFGVAPTPEAVTDAVRRMDTDVAIAKLNAAMEEAKSQNETIARVYEAEVRQVEAINRTMQVEILPENRHWFFTGWRPACGWIFVANTAAFGVLLFWATLLAISGNERPLKIIVEAWPSYTAYFGMLSLMVGVNIWARSKDKETRAVAPAATVAVPKKR